MSDPVSIVESVCLIDKAKAIAALVSLESAMLEHDQVEIPVIHRFNGDMYAREITIPKDTLLTGRIHKFDHFDIMLSGDISVSTDDGEVKRLTGLNIMEGKAGKKRAGYAHEDTHWITIHSAEERNPEEMYEFLTCGSFEDLNSFNISLNRADYLQMVKSMAMTEEEIQAQVQNIDDMIGLESPEIYVSSSGIHGEGLFSSVSYSANEVIEKARIGEFRTIAGRYTNHAFSPNAKMIVTDKGVNLVALKIISKNEEITVNYRDVLDSRMIAEDLCQQ